MQLQELEPDWNVDDVELAAYEPDSGYGDGAGVAGDFLESRRDHSAHILFADPGDGSDRRRRLRSRSQLPNQGTISAPKVIVATGPWTRPLLQQQDTICRSNANITRSQFSEMRRT